MINSVSEINNKNIAQIKLATSPTNFRGATASSLERTPDSDLVEFDWQSSVAGLYINLGNTRPTTKNAHFKLLPPGKDTVLNITDTRVSKT